MSGPWEKYSGAPSGPWEKYGGSAPVEDTSHDLLPYLKEAPGRLWEGMKAASEKPLYQHVYDTVVQPGVDSFNAHMDAGDSVTGSVLHGLDDSLGSVARAGEALIMPASTIPVNTYFDSREQGNTVGDSLKDARNAAMLSTAPAMAGAAIRGVANSELAGPIARDAMAVGKNVASDVGNKLLPKTVNGLVNGETAAILKQRAANALSPAPEAPPPPMSEVSLAPEDSYIPKWKQAPPPVSAGAATAAIVRKAAEQGPQAAAIAHYLGSQRDPDYAASLQKKAK